MQLKSEPGEIRLLKIGFINDSFMCCEKSANSARDQLHTFSGSAAVINSGRVVRQIALYYRFPNV